MTVGSLQQVGYARGGAEALKLYEVKDPHGFSEIDLQDFAEAYRLSDIVGDGKVTTDEVPRMLIVV